MGVGYQVFFSGELGVLQVGMSKFVQHANHLSEKNLINYSQGGAHIFLSYHSGALTIALLSWPSFHQDILEKTSWPSFHQDILEKTVCWRRRTLCVGGGGISSFFSGGLGVLQVGMSKFVQHTNWGSYKLGCPSLFNIPTTSLKKNLINYSQGGARFF